MRMAVGRALVSTLAVAAVLAGCAGRSGKSPDQIGAGVFLVAGRLVPGQQPDGNSVIFRAPQGAVIVDTGRHREHTQAALDRVAELGLVPRAVINTHWHLDHTGGNVLVRERFPNVRIYASDAIAEARTGFLANYRRQLEDMVASDKPSAESKEGFRREMALIDAGDRLAPDEAIASSGRRTFAGRELDVRLERHAVTAGDVWVLDPATRVAAVGDLVTLPAPFLDTACPSGWQSALARVAAADWNVLVPGHGQPMTRHDFDTYRKAFDALLACTTTSKPSADCVTAWFKDGGELVAKNDPGNGHDLVAYYVDQVLRGDPARIAVLCGS